MYTQSVFFSLSKPYMAKDLSFAKLGATTVRAMSLILSVAFFWLIIYFSGRINWSIKCLQKSY